MRKDKLWGQERYLELSAYIPPLLGKAGGRLGKPVCFKVLELKSHGPW